MGGISCNASRLRVSASKDRLTGPSRPCRVAPVEPPLPKPHYRVAPPWLGAVGNHIYAISMAQLGTI